MGGKRDPEPIEEDVYNMIVQLVKDSAKPVAEREGYVAVCCRSKLYELARRKLSRHHFSVEKLFDPVKGDHVECLSYSGKIVPKKVETNGIIQHFMTKSKGDGSRKLAYQISCHYVGISRNVIQSRLDQDIGYQERKAEGFAFRNKPPLRPVTSSQVMRRNQADLVSLNNVGTSEGYKYVLVLVDVFSRFLWLRALKDKSSKEVANHLGTIWQQFGTPLSLQTDNGGEFKKEVVELCQSLNVQVRTSRPRHPQSQGKTERSNRTWKAKIRYDLQQECADSVDWAENLREYSRICNEGAHRSLGYKSPFQVFFGRVPNTLNPERRREDEEEVLLEMTVDDCQIDKEPSDLDVLLDEELVLHQNMVDQIREEALASSCKQAEKMVKTRLAKNPPTQYKLDDEVVIRSHRPDARLRRGGSSIKNTTCARGKVVQCRPEQHQYKVQTEEGVRWVNVQDITSVTAEIEKTRKKRQQTEREQGEKEESTASNNYECGLINIGQTCWFNSTVQAFKHYLRVPENVRNNMLQELRVLMQEMHSADGCKTNVIDPRSHLEVILQELTSRGFSLGQQQDVHEFVSCVLEYLQAEKAHVPLMSVHTRKCLDCGELHVSAEESRPCLELEIPPDATGVQDCLFAHCSPEPMTDGEQADCEGCGKKTASVRQEHYTNTPDSVVILLKRYRLGGGNMPVVTKINNYLAVDRSIVLPAQHGQSKYTLRAVQCHAGLSPQTGHYYTVSFQHKTPVVYNDRQVTEGVDLKEMKADCYILHYVKREAGLKRTGHSSGKHRMSLRKNPPKKHLSDEWETAVKNTRNRKLPVCAFPLDQIPDVVLREILQMCAASSEKQAKIVMSVCTKWRQLLRVDLTELHKKDVAGLLHSIPREVITAPLSLAPCGNTISFQEIPPEDRDSLPVLSCELPNGLTPLFMDARVLIFSYALHMLGQGVRTDESRQYVLMPEHVMIAFDKWRATPPLYIFLTREVREWATACQVTLSHRCRDVMPITPTQWRAFQEWMTREAM